MPFAPGFSQHWHRSSRRVRVANVADPAQNSFDGLKKADLEVSLDDYLAERGDQFSSNPKIAGYYNSRAKATGSPVKKEIATTLPDIKMSKRRLAPKPSTDDLT